MGAAVALTTATMEYRPLLDAFPYAKLNEDQLREMAQNLLVTLEREHAQARLSLLQANIETPSFVTGNPQQGEKQRLITDRQQVKEIRGEIVAIARAHITSIESKIKTLHAHPFWGELLKPKPEPDDGMTIATVGESAASISEET